MKKFFISVFSLWMWLPIAPAASALDLDEAFELAVKNHEAVLRAGESVVQSELGINKAFSNLLPTLTVEGTYTRFSDKKTQHIHEVQ
jgi:outer membrane protein TolC